MKNRPLNFKGAICTHGFLFLAFLFTAFNLQAQTRPVTGKVVANENDSALAAATVRVKGTTTAVSTNADGSFTVNAAPNAVLEVSTVGYAAQEFPLRNQTSVTIRLVSEAMSLQQIVVVGYGTQKRKDVTGSVSSISGDLIAKVPITTLDQGLQGRSAGVQVTNNDGAPGSGVQILIRGVGSFGDNNPLYVVDGYPTRNISTLNPNDIATIDILKDASAAAIYGNQASNGVVMITTKRGSKHGTQVTFDAEAAIQSRPKTYDVLNAQQFGALAYQQASIDGYTALPNWANADTLHEADWQDAVYQTGLRQSYNLGIRGGSDKVQTAFSAGYFNQKGIVLGSMYKRYNLSANVDYSPSTWLKSQSSFKYTRGDQKIAFGSGGQGAGSGIGYLSKLPPTLDGGNMITSQINAGEA
jgi:TonB-linked SusC/RagA family outer membrane protein